jgi:hypothetical protein
MPFALLARTRADSLVRANVNADRNVHVLTAPPMRWSTRPLLRESIEDRFYQLDGFGFAFEQLAGCAGIEVRQRRGDLNNIVAGFT